MLFRFQDFSQDRGDGRSVYSLMILAAQRSTCVATWRGHRLHRGDVKVHVWPITPGLTRLYIVPFRPGEWSESVPMERLKEYRRKRDFRRTPEPEGGSESQAEGPGGSYVIHKHAARNLHYDLRLEQDGVLRSWALPKGPGIEPGDRRLAVQVEDHPLEYGEFEGTIPQKEYGGGTMMLWDCGRWMPVKKNNGDQLDFVLEGQKLHGAWTLVRMHGRDDEDGRNWLLIKRKDEPTGSVPPPGDHSVMTGRSMEEIARDEQSKPERGNAPGKITPPEPAELRGASRKPLPEDFRPKLATLAPKAPSEPGWIHEIKFDGYRIMVRIQNGQSRLISRNGLDWTARFPELAAQLKQMPAEDALIDGEVVALGADGISSFRGLQEALRDGRTGALVYQAFDLLSLNGYDLTRVALVERKQTLARLLAAGGYAANGFVRYTDHLDASGPAFHQQACRLGLEGIIAKRRTEAYQSGRAKDWLKIKCTRQDEFVVGGYTDPAGSRSGFGALLLGANDADGRLVHVGRVGTGFSGRQLRDLQATLAEREVSRAAFHDPPAARGVHWVRPELVVDVEFAGWTRDGQLRHASFRGLREDKEPDEVRLAGDGKAAAIPAANGGAPRRSSKRSGSGSDSASDNEVEGVKLSHPERILYPDQGVTKLDLARYYAEVQDWILPQLAERPLSLVRCPQGRNKQCFFQKHPGEAIAASVPRVTIQEKEGSSEYLYVRSAADLVALVQAGVLEFHPWGSRVDDLERPDYMVFDLDPGEGVAWSDMQKAATGMRDRLSTLGLTGFLRTTGGKGLHVVVPIKPGEGWAAVKAFAHAVCRQHAHDDPKRFTTDMSKARRKGRIFLDYLRNGRGATAIASYSTRARQGAPVAVPLRWDELNAALRSDRYNTANLRRRLGVLKSDPWEDFEDARRPLSRDMRRILGLE